MVYRSADEQFRRMKNHANGKKLAKEARDAGEYALAWKHAQAYDLDVYDLMELKLPEKYRPKGFRPRVPKAMGCV